MTDYYWNTNMILAWMFSDLMNILMFNNFTAMKLPTENCL